MVLGTLRAVVVGHLPTAGLVREDVRLLEETVQARLRAEGVLLAGVLRPQARIGPLHRLAADRVARADVLAGLRGRRDALDMWILHAPTGARSVPTGRSRPASIDSSLVGVGTVRYGAAAERALLRGATQMTALMAPTFGPAAGIVAITRIVGGDVPELLDSGATIARRTIRLADPFENLGAMLVRHMAIQLFERVGDVTVTAALIAQALLAGGIRYGAAGGDLVALRRGIERATEAALADLRRQARPIDGAEELTALVRGALHDDRLAEMVGEILDSVGADGPVLVEATSATTTGYEYVDGVRWDEGAVSAYCLDEATGTGRLLWPRILCTDRPLASARQVLPAVEACLATDDRALLVIAPEVRDAALALLLLNRQKGVLRGVLAVRAPAVGTQRTRILEDIAVLTGGRCIHAEAGERLDAVTAADLGRARQAWATRGAFGILGGQGSKEAIRRRLAAARVELRQAADDRSVRKRIEERIGRLAGTGAVIRVGAPTEAARDELTLRVEAALKAGRLALEGGVVAGGGAALVAAGRAARSGELSGDERVGAGLLEQALQVPMRRLAARAGVDPGAVVWAAHERGPGWTFDAARGEWVRPWERRHRLLDPLPVLEAAVAAGVSAACSGLASGALVRTRGPERSRA
jgi:chaperonin GroEL